MKKRRSNIGPPLRPRPAVPLVLYCAAGIWLGCLGAYVLAEAYGWAVALGFAAAVCGLGAVVVCIVRKRQKPFAALCGALGFAVLGIVLVCAQGMYLESIRSTGLAMSGETGTFRIVEDPAQGQYGRTAIAELSFPETANIQSGFLPAFDKKIKVRIRLDDDDDIAYGQEFQARAVLSEPSDTVVSYYNRNGIALVCRIYDREDLSSSSVGILAQARNAFADHVAQLASVQGLQEEPLALINALVVGDRSGLEESDLYQEVRATGLAHLVAVSGAHLVIVLGFVQVFLHVFHAPRWFAVGLQCIFLMVYLVMVGFPISCVRAACMSCATLLAFGAHRRSHALSALGVVAIVLIAVDPTTATSVSFALSALATLGIVLFMPLFSSWFPTDFERLQTALIDPIAMTFAALVLTFPVSIACFSQFPFVSPVSNVVAGPLVSIMCGLGTIAFACMPLQPVCDALLFVVYAVGKGFTAFVDALMLIPGINAPMYAPVALLVAVSVGLALALWLTWPKRPSWRSTGAVLAVLISVTVLSSALRIGADEIVMLDVGQGDAFLLRSDGVTMLVDTGNQSSDLLAALARQGITHLDALLITHADDDHCGCIPDLWGIVSCEKVLVARGMKDEADASAMELVENASTYVGEGNVVEVGRGDVLSVGAFSLDVIAPETLSDAGGNADSICFLLASDVDANGASEWSGLFCGDAEAEVLETLVEEGLLGQVDIYKVGHHGALAALDEELAQILHPEISLISVGENNTYGHPRQEVIDLLQQQGSEVYRTDEQGDVTCVLGANSVEVRTLR